MAIRQGGAGERIAGSRRGIKAKSEDKCLETKGGAGRQAKPNDNFTPLRSLSLSYILLHSTTSLQWLESNQASHRIWILNHSPRKQRVQAQNGVRRIGGFCSCMSRDVELGIGQLLRWVYRERLPSRYGTLVVHG